MLTIRDAQMQAFLDHRRFALAKALVSQAAELLTANSHPFDRAGLPLALETLIQTAIHAGIAAPSQAARFTLLACRHFGLDLSSMPPPVTDILYAAGVPADLKLGMLEDFLAEYGAAAGA